MIIYKGYVDKTGKNLTLKEYNKHAQQAHRKGLTTERYMEVLGFKKVCGRGRPRNESRNTLY